jgi:hypothetical protein
MMSEHGEVTPDKFVGTGIMWVPRTAPTSGGADTSAA